MRHETKASIQVNRNASKKVLTTCVSTLVEVKSPIGRSHY